MVNSGGDDSETRPQRDDVHEQANPPTDPSLTHLGNHGITDVE
jgi:hypothetical protein